MRRCKKGHGRMAEVIGVSEAQLRFVTNTSSGMGLMKCGNVVIPFDNTIEKGTDLYNLLVSKKFALLKKPVNSSRFRTHPAVPELSALCIILAVFLKGGKNVSADSA